MDFGHLRQFRRNVTDPGSIEIEEVRGLAPNLVEALGYRTVAGVAELFRDLSPDPPGFAVV